MISDVSPPTILVVEDEAIVQECLVTELKEAGCRVLSADTGEDALAIINDRAHNIDWLFTVIRLPGCIDGWRVADEFRLTHPFRPVVYATAYAPGEMRPQLHASLVFRKPYRPAEIVAAFCRLSTELQGATDERLTALRSAALDGPTAKGNAPQALVSSHRRAPPAQP